MKPELAVLPLEVWADVFESPIITRQEVAQFANGIRNRNFAEKLQKILHDPKCGKHSLRFLKISSMYATRLQKRIFRNPASLAVAPRAGMHYKTCEFPEIEMPENIIKFKHFDHQVLEFLDKMRPLFNNVFLKVGMAKSMESDAENIRTLLGNLLPMLANIRKISCENYCLELLERHFPGTLALARELQLLAKPTFIPTYLDWLSWPQDVGVHGPKFLKIDGPTNTISAIVDAVRQQFLAATTPATFVIFLEFSPNDQHHRVDEFMLENAKTNEQLSVRNAQFEASDSLDDLFDALFGDRLHYVEILRHPTGDNIKMQEWIQQRAYYEKKHKDGFGIDVSGSYEAEQLIWISCPEFGPADVPLEGKEAALDPALLAEIQYYQQNEMLRRCRSTKRRKPAQHPDSIPSSICRGTGVQTYSLEQLLSSGSPPLTIGYITNSNEAEAMDQKGNESTSEDEPLDNDEAGPSTSAAKKMKLE